MGAGLLQAFEQQQGAVLAGLPSVDEGDHFETQAAGAPVVDLEAMDADEGAAVLQPSRALAT